MKPALFLIPIILLLVLTIPASAQQITGVTSEDELQSLGSRLRGLAILPDMVRLDPAQSTNAEIRISWLGDEPIIIKQITAGDFRGWFTFPTVPFDVNPVIIELQGTDLIIPTATAQELMSEGIIPFTVTPPRTICGNIVDVRNCIEERVYNIPITFDLEFAGQIYKDTFEIVVDLRGLPIDVATVQNLIIGTIIIAFVLGAGSFIRNRGRSGRKIIRSRQKGFGGSSYEKRVKRTISRI